MNQRAIKEYNKRSRSYDSEKIAPFRKQINKLIIDNISFSKPMTVLEIACGTGIALEEVTLKNPDGLSIGLDISKNMLTIARKKKNLDTPLKLIEGSSSFLPFQNGTIDLIYCTCAFHLFPEPAKVLSEIFRVLKENGILLLEELARDKNFGIFLWDIINKILVPSHKKYYSVTELKNLIEKAEFKKIELLHLESSYFKYGKIFFAPMIYSAIK